MVEDNFTLKLKEINKRISQHVKQLLEEYKDNTITISDFLDIEYRAKEFISESYKDLVDDPFEHIDVIAKINIPTQSIIIAPNNLFTALMSSGRYNGDKSPEEIIENNIYYDKVGEVSVTYDNNTNTIKNYKVQ